MASIIYLGKPPAACAVNLTAHCTPVYSTRLALLCCQVGISGEGGAGVAHWGSSVDAGVVEGGFVVGGALLLAGGLVEVFTVVCGWAVVPPAAVVCGCTVVPPAIVVCGWTVVPPAIVVCGWTVVPPAMVVCGSAVVDGGPEDCAPVRQTEMLNLMLLG